MKSNEHDSNVNDKIRAKNRRALLQDVALLFFLGCILGSGLVVGFSDTEAARLENIVMFLIMCASIILAAYRFRYLAVVLASVQTCFFAAYKIYTGFFLGGEITLFSFFWLILPVGCVVSMLLFMHETYRAEIISEMLEKQIHEQILTDRVTGLYNLKSMYMDLERQIAFSKRNNLKLSLMILELRYKDELKSILNGAQFDALRVAYVRVLEDSIRLEDRLYALDEDGQVGIICTCDKPGAQIMKQRILNHLAQPEQFRDIIDRAIRVDVRVGIFEYREGEVTNAIDLKKKAENEMQYDV